jgi:hypothetical protein
LTCHTFPNPSCHLHRVPRSHLDVETGPTVTSEKGMGQHPGSSLPQLFIER